MPTYEYRCRACGHEFEKFQQMSDEPIRVCPACECDQVERLISVGGGILFRGPGFYATDYRKDGPGSKKTRESTDGTGPTETSDEKKKPARSGDSDGKTSDA